MPDVSGAGPRDQWIYHFTHMDNLQRIFSTGRLLCDVAARDGQTRTEVGDPAIKQSRRLRPVLAGPGGLVGDYVPFYFASRSPMMYRIACDHRDSKPDCYAGGDRPLVYLVTTIGAVVDAGLAWVGTDGNAATATSEFTADLGSLSTMVDWPLMMAERWSNAQDDMDRQRRRQAEFLVHDALPTQLIRWIATYSDQHRSQAGRLISGHPLAERIIVRPKWYYGFERR
ncbi:type II toxin-antitoxin system toxin DNA ADP-ribosyl transferase DarT [Asanoa siamensis]|uniref:DarT domain-containing protein n=1 Tax=Asanoa siamensis TaxID=926357 RepID=A0ABQ4D1C5_9ACTN|nr:DUF4433 domain-containing protein [Asanoa siamensis]GIF77340.1 hypothetical protein Asi02nite_68580 [Asanoa siamensis]